MIRFPAIAILAFSVILTSNSLADDAGVRSRESFNAAGGSRGSGRRRTAQPAPSPGPSGGVSWSRPRARRHQGERRGQRVRWRSGNALVCLEWRLLTSGSSSTWGVIGKSAELTWTGIPDLNYGSAIETSPDGKAWTPFAPGPARLVRVRATKLPEAKWASIREIRLTDLEGQPIKNTRVAGGDTPSAAAFDDSAWRDWTFPMTGDRGPVS